MRRCFVARALLSCSNHVSVIINDQCTARRQWERLARTSNPATQVHFDLRKNFQVEMSTVAFVKMYESIVACDLLPDDSPCLGKTPDGRPAAVTLHVCEAPGAFISATNHFMHTHRLGWDWRWVGNSLNPHFEGNDVGAMIDDDKLIVKTLSHWCWGADNSGNIMKAANIRAIWQRVRQECAAAAGIDAAAAPLGAPLALDAPPPSSSEAAPAQPVSSSVSSTGSCSASAAAPGAILVTADGAISAAHDPNRQEQLTAGLHYCELVAALGALAPGGSFFWKLFTTYEHASLCSLYLMGCFFEIVLVYKPATSKPANSEVYAVGQRFRGATPEQLDLLLSLCGDKMFEER